MQGKKNKTKTHFKWKYLCTFYMVNDTKVDGHTTTRQTYECSTMRDSKKQEGASRKNHNFTTLKSSINRLKHIYVFCDQINKWRKGNNKRQMNNKNITGAYHIKKVSHISLTLTLDLQTKGFRMLFPKPFAFVDDVYNRKWENYMQETKS